MKNFSLILPTRERKFLVNQLFESIITTASNIDSLEIILYIDKDDLESCAINDPVLNVRKVYGPARTMGAMFECCYKVVDSRYVILLNDDVVFRTKNWDIKILEAFSDFEDDLALVYLNDLYYGSKLSCFPVISSPVHNLMGGICPFDYGNHCIDSHIFDIFERLAALGFERRKYLPNVVLEHMHYGLTVDSYENNGNNQDRSVDINLYGSLAGQRRKIAAEMSAYIQSYPQKKTKTLSSVSIILNLGGCQVSDQAVDCLNAIYDDNEFRSLNYEIIIVSNKIKEAELFSVLPGKFRNRLSVIHTSADGVNAVNEAASVSKNDYLVFLDQGCLSRCGWLQALVECAQAEQAAVVGSKLINLRNGRIEHVGLAFFKDNQQVKGTLLYKGLSGNHPAVNKIRQLQAVVMPGMLVRREDFLQVEGFDGNFAEFEHIDLCLKMCGLGRKVLCSPDAGLYYNNDNDNSNSTCNLKYLPEELAKRLECDMQKHLAEDGFDLCSALHDNYVCQQPGT